MRRAAKNQSPGNARRSGAVHFKSTRAGAQIYWGASCVDVEKAGVIQGIESKQNQTPFVSGCFFYCNEVCGNWWINGGTFAMFTA